MKKILLSASIIAALFTSVAHAETITGTVLAYDRKANLIVMDDKAVYGFDGQTAKIPAELKAGDKIEIDGTGEGEDGYGSLTAVKILK